MSVPVVELAPLQVEGYPKLACHMGTYPECSIHRRFASLNSQNLLYFQAELIHLEHKLRRLEACDAKSSEGDRSSYSKDWYWLNNSAVEGNGDQLETVLAIRSKLKEYNDAVIQQSVLSRLTDPAPHDLRSLQDWLQRTNMGNLSLIGKDRDTWGSSDEPLKPNADLFTFQSNTDRDPFSTWWTQVFIRWFHHKLWHRIKKPDDLESGIVSYEARTMQRHTAYATTIVASLLPMLTIIVLYHINSMNTRMGLISLFIILFTICLSFFTNSARSEVFIATATFTAVQVVFISANNGTVAGVHA